MMEFSIVVIYLLVCWIRLLIQTIQKHALITRRSGEDNQFAFSSFDPMPYTLNTGNGTKVVYCFGEREAGLVYAGPVQDYTELKAECWERGTLFQDPVFKPDPSVLDPRHADWDVIWKRPGEMAEKPQFYVDGMSRFDINQGGLGDCWFLAAIADLTQRPQSLSQVIPRGQSFDKTSYCGVFHFIFWIAGKWVDVPVDDRLPTFQGRLLYNKSTDANEFWSALLEKAYAKLFGSYSALIGGRTSEALQHFTGGVTDLILLQSPDPVATFTNLLELRDQQTFMAAAIFIHFADENERRTFIETFGLVPMHAYSITDIQWVHQQLQGSLKNCQVPLVRLRNPWGRVEWKGDWSDRSPLWETVGEETKRRLRVEQEEDGEFWMEYKDFVHHFTLVELCHVRFPGSRPGVHHMDDGVRLEVDALHAEWKNPHSAGGSFLSGTYHRNPKMPLVVKEHSRVTVAILQKNRRAPRVEGVQQNLPIGFNVFKLSKEDMGTPMDKTFFARMNPHVTAEPIALHENARQFDVAPGEYCIVLATEEPHIEAQFLARMIVEKKGPHSSLRTKKSWMIQKYAQHIPVATEEQISNTREQVIRMWNDRRRD